MKAVKANKVVMIDKAEEAQYKARGFDIYDDNDKLIAHGDGKTVPYAKYEKVVKELEALKAEAEKATKTAKKE